MNLNHEFGVWEMGQNYIKQTNKIRADNSNNSRYHKILPLFLERVHNSYCWKKQLNFGKASRKLEMIWGGIPCPCMRTWWNLSINDKTTFSSSASSKEPATHHKKQQTTQIDSRSCTET